MKSTLKAIIPFFLFLCICFIFRNSCTSKANLLIADSEGYYMYLPAWFIYDGYSEIPVRSTGQFYRLENGNYYTKYSYGVALMELPFFLVAHGINNIFGWYPSDGYAKIYQKGIFIAACFYCFIGLFFFYNLLRSFFDRKIAIIIPSITFLGTNLLHYTLREPGMSHAYSFCLTTIFIGIIFKHKLDALQSHFWRLAFLLGMIVLIRPLNILILTYPIGLIFYERGSVKEGFLFIREQILKLILLFIPAAVLLGINILEWSRMQGETVFYSYKDEGFKYWNNPKLFKVLFDVQNGFFLYAPVMILGVFAMIKFWKKQNDFKYFALVLGLLSYFFASWWAWWFGGAYGHRCYVDHLIFLALPMAYLMRDVFKSQNKIKKMGLSFFVLITVFYSIRMNILYTPPWDGPNWNWSTYLEQFAKVFFI